MTSNEKNERIILQMNELFDELITDAYDFSKDIMMGINLMPFAIAFIVLVGIGYGYYSFIWNTGGGIFSNIMDLAMLGIILFIVIILTRKYLELKRKYSTLFDLKEKLDKIEEI